MNFGGGPDRLKAEYIDVYERVYAKVISNDKFDEHRLKSNIFRSILDMTRSTEVKAEENFPITA